MAKTLSRARRSRAGCPASPNRRVTRMRYDEHASSVQSFFTANGGHGGRRMAPPTRECIVVLGMPGCGKTWALQRVVDRGLRGARVVSVGALGSDADVQGRWPRTGCRCAGGTMCAGHTTPGTRGFRPPVRRAATLSKNGRIALLGDFRAVGTSGIDVGFEAAGAYRAWWARNGLLPFVPPALERYGVRLLVTEGLYLSQRTVDALAAGTVQRTLLELNTPSARCASQYRARPGVVATRNAERDRGHFKRVRARLSAAGFTAPKGYRPRLSASAVADYTVTALARFETPFVRRE